MSKIYDRLTNYHLDDSDTDGLPDIPISDTQAKVLQNFIDDYGMKIIIMKG